MIRSIASSKLGKGDMKNMQNLLQGTTINDVTQTGEGGSGFMTPVRKAQEHNRGSQKSPNLCDVIFYVKASGGLYSVIFTNNLKSKIIIFVDWTKFLEHRKHKTASVLDHAGTLGQIQNAEKIKKHKDGKVGFAKSAVLA